MELIRQEEAAHGNDVQALSIDGAGTVDPGVALWEELKDRAELIALLVECGFDEIDVPWKADVFRGAPQDKLVKGPATKETGPLPERA